MFKCFHKIPSKEFVKLVILNFSNQFHKEAYMDRKDWRDSVFEKEWMNRLYCRGRNPKETAKIIERAYEIYKFWTKSEDYMELTNQEGIIYKEPKI